MSIDTIAREIASVDRDINSVERSIHPIDANISRKQKEAHSIPYAKLDHYAKLNLRLSFTKKNGLQTIRIIIMLFVRDKLFCST